MKIKELKGKITVKWLADDKEPPLQDISVCKKVGFFRKKVEMVALTPKSSLITVR